MSWAEIVRDSLQRVGPYVLWVVLALGTSILVAFIRDPLSRVLREAREQLRTLRNRLLARSAIALGRKSRRFWLARQSEPPRTVAGALDRLAEALPTVGKKSLGLVATLQADLQKQLGILERLGLHSPSPRTGPRDTASTTPAPMGSWWKLLLLGFIAGLTGAANSFLLNEFFQGVLTSDPLFPSAFPDLHVSHVFAVLIFMMEVAIGFALHHFAEEHQDESPARKLLGFAPWLVLAGLVCLEGWAYALLSYQIDIPERLNLSPNSGLYTFARYFLALFGAGLTLLLSSLGYLLGKEVDKLHAGSEARQQERLLKRYGRVISGGADQVERTVRALAALRAAAQSFQLDLVSQFKREIDATSSSENLQAAVRDALAEILDSAGQVDGTRARWLDRRELRDRRPVRTRAQALADMCLFTVALALLVAVSWVSVEYVAALVRSVQDGRPSADLFGLVSGMVMTGFALSAGHVAGRGSGHGHGSTVAFPLAAAAGLVAIAVANRTLGPSTPLNLLFGLLHAGILVILGAGANAALINTVHLLRLAGMYLERGVVSAGALMLWMPRAVLAVLDWTVRLVAVFGQLVVRPRPAVRYGVVEVPRGARIPREMRTPARRFTDKAYQPTVRGERA
jgi:hypothetical protein